MISSSLCPRPAAGESRTTAEGESAAGPSPSSRERGRCPAGARSRGGRGCAEGRGGEGTGLEGAEVGARPSRGGDGGGRATPFAARGRRAMARRGTPQHVPPGTSSQARQSTAGRGWGGWVRWAVRACGTRVCLSGVAKAVPSPYHPKSRVPGPGTPPHRALRALRRCAAVPGSGVPVPGPQFFPAGHPNRDLPSVPDLAWPLARYLPSLRLKGPQNPAAGR